MLILLPPSETKRDGGDANAPLELARLSFPRLTATRRSLLAATRALSRNRAAMSSALRLGSSQQFEVTRNRELRTSPTLAAIDRYSGVLYDALGSESLSVSARLFARDHVAVHSALFGLLGADDPIPAYRLSHDSRLPALSLRKAWSGPISAEIERFDGVVFDLRSEGYRALGPAPVGARSTFLRVVTDSGREPRRALNHFNKSAKGELVRAICEAGIDHGDLDSLTEWAARAGFNLAQTSPGILELGV